MSNQTLHTPPPPGEPAGIESTPAPETAASPRPQRAERTKLARFSNLDWPVVLGIGGVHLGCLAAPFFFSWTGLLIAAVLYWLTAGVGITLCYHRLLTHRSFTTPAWFKYVLTLCGCLAWQGGPIQWVGTHRIHHKHSDDELDPHSPQHGFAWAHTFWCMFKESEGFKAADAAKDLSRDAILRFMNAFFWAPQLLLAIGLYASGELFAWMGWGGGGVSWVLWGVCVRTVAVYHATWFVNSATHTWGYRNYETGDNSTNLWWVSLLSFGEGWHNNHHANQTSAAHGLRWFEFDPTYWTIRALELVGLARDVVLPTPERLPR